MTEIKPGERITITAVVESAGHDDQHVIVNIGGRPVQVPASSLLAAATENAPKAPGQCWAALKDDMAKVLAEWQRQADEDQIPYAGAFVNAYGYVLDRMQKLEAGR